MELFDTVETTAYPELVAVWESSVRATHDFLKEDDLQFYKPLVPPFFDQVDLYVVKDGSRIVGFMGVSGENLEMLFVSATEIGKGIGKKLMRHALDLGVTKVDVNQDNEKAVAFYRHFGFEVTSVSEVDGFGKPYPMLHLTLAEKS